MTTAGAMTALTSRDDPLAPLIQGALDRDPTALRNLLDAVAPDVLRVVQLLVGAGAADADDLTQEALLGLLRALPDYRGECSVRRYARRIAARVAMTSRRRAARKAAHHERFLERDAREPAIAPAASGLAERRRAAMRELLVELPEAQAEALVLRVVLGHSVAEIADATSAPLNTVRSRLRLAKDALRRRITDDPTLRELLEVPT